MKGPYKYIRHPQYLGIIIMTFGLTLLSVDSGPLNPTYPISSNEFFKRSWILYMWIAEVILYIILAKIEDLSLKAKYGENFLNFAKIVPFMFPVLNLYKDRKDKKSKDQLISKNWKIFNEIWKADKKSVLNLIIFIVISLNQTFIFLTKLTKLIYNC